MGKRHFCLSFFHHLSFFHCECECDIFDLQIRTTFEYYYGGVMPNSSMDDVLLTRVTERQARHGRDGKIKIK